MPVPEHLRPTVQRILAAPVAPPPTPWRLVGSFSVGGLTGVGFAPRSDMVLVVSSAGRGVFDCTTGEPDRRGPGGTTASRYC